ncbi:MAG: hypothetical protein LBM75_07215 [Myxococcales bacterium]|jgi:hypothetical protein|nr:hypothetical protein [Myxococcales bacterium]
MKYLNGYANQFIDENGKLAYFETDQQFVDSDGNLAYFDGNPEFIDENNEPVYLDKTRGFFDRDGKQIYLKNGQRLIYDGEPYYYKQWENGIQVFALFGNEDPDAPSRAVASTIGMASAMSLATTWEQAVAGASSFGFFVDVSNLEIPEFLQSDNELMNAIRSIEGKKFFRTKPMSKEYVINITRNVSKLEAIRLLSQIAKVDEYFGQATPAENVEQRNAQELRQMPMQDFFRDNFFTIGAFIIFGLIELEMK